MRRIAVVVSAVVALIGFSVTLGGAAWSATSASSGPVITFDDAAQVARLTIPSPACPEAQPTCQWKFFLNEPKLSVDVATVFGTSGTLSIPYPPDFCGVIQADAYVGPPWVAKRGFQHTIDDCNPPASTTTTTLPPATTTTTTEQPAPPTTTTTTTTVTIPPTVIAVSAPPPAPPAAPPTVTPTTVTPVAAPLTELPFTGRDIKPFLFAGLTLLALGLGLLASSESWRRVGMRVRSLRTLPSRAVAQARLRLLLSRWRLQLLSGFRLGAGRLRRWPAALAHGGHDLCLGVGAALSRVTAGLCRAAAAAVSPLWPWSISTSPGSPVPSVGPRRHGAAGPFPGGSTLAGSRHGSVPSRQDTRVLPGSAAFKARVSGRPRAPAQRRYGPPRLATG